MLLYNFTLNYIILYYKNTFIAKLGIEPNLTDHETIVLPLHYLALLYYYF
jgi:hypothetical protein